MPPSPLPTHSGNWGSPERSTPGLEVGWVRGAGILGATTYGKERRLLPPHPAVQRSSGPGYESRSYRESGYTSVFVAAGLRLLLFSCPNRV